MLLYLETSMHPLSARWFGVLLILCSTSIPALANGSWQSIPFGASVGEVLTKGQELGVARIDKPKRIPAGPNAPNGLYGPLGISGYEIGASKYNVTLIFDQKTDQLWGVVLSFAGKDPQFEVSGLVQALTEKYGQPVSKRNDGASMQEVIWHDKQARISLMYVPSASHLQLNYEPPSRSVDSKL